MFTLMFPAFAAIVKFLCVCSSLYILFSPLAMWVYIFGCMIPPMGKRYAPRKLQKFFA